MIKTPEERAEQAAKLLKTFSETMVRLAPKMGRCFERTEEDGEQVSFNLDNYPFTLSWGETLKPSIGRSIWTIQFSLCIWYQTPGSRHSPPEDIDTTLITSQSISDCIRTAFETVAKEEIRCVMENDGYDQMAKEEAAMEQV